MKRRLPRSTLKALLKKHRPHLRMGAATDLLVREREADPARRLCCEAEAVRAWRGGPRRAAGGVVIAHARTFLLHVCNYCKGKLYFKRKDVPRSHTVGNAFYKV